VHDSVLADRRDGAERGPDRERMDGDRPALDAGQVEDVVTAAIDPLEEGMGTPAGAGVAPDGAGI
jgi:hypothetical protein